MINDPNFGQEQIADLINDPVLGPKINRLAEEIFYKRLLNKSHQTSQPESQPNSKYPDRFQIKVALCTCSTLCQDGPEHFLESVESNLSKIRTSDLLFQGSTILGIISTVLAFRCLVDPPEDKDYYNIAPNPFAFGLIIASAMGFAFKESVRKLQNQNQLNDLLTPQNHLREVPRAQEITPHAHAFEQGLIGVNPDRIRAGILEGPIVSRRVERAIESDQSTL